MQFEQVWVFEAALCVVKTKLNKCFAHSQIPIVTREVYKTSSMSTTASFPFTSTYSCRDYNYLRKTAPCEINMWISEAFCGPYILKKGVTINEHNVSL